MLQNYLQIAFRSLLKKKGFSFINIFGLAFGMACVILILLYVNSELSYDTFHKDADNIYRVAWFDESPQTRTPHPMAQAMVNDFPEVIAATSLSPLWGPGLTQRTFSIWNPENEEKFDEKGILSVDSTFFDVFSFELIRGNKAKVLRQIGGILISESMAKKYFGDSDPVGKYLAINNKKVLTMVEGVFKDVPDISHFHFDFLVSYVTLKAMEPESKYYTWADFGHFNYVKLQNGSNPNTLQSKLLPWLANYTDINDQEIKTALARNEHFKLQRLTDIHLKSHIRWELEKNGNIEYVYVMTSAAFLILLIASLNFMNLTTARSTERAREIGVRKSLGAEKQHIVKQFIGESMITVIISLILAGLLVEIILPLFNTLTNKSLDIEYIQHPQIILALLMGALLIGLISGLYPAFFLSSVNTITTLKGKMGVKPGGVGFRKVLVVFQFVVALILITGAVIITNQFDYLLKHDKGFNEEGIVVVPFKNYDLLDRFETIKKEMEEISGVVQVSASSSVPGNKFNNHEIHLTNDPNIQIQSAEVYVDANIFSTLGLQIVEGRGFVEDNIKDREEHFIVNETAVKQLGLENPIGAQLTWETNINSEGFINGTIIGVVKDFNFQSLHVPIRPLLFKLEPDYNQLIVKIESNKSTEVIAALSKVYSKFESNFQFEYSFLSDDIAFQYSDEAKTAYVFNIFSVIAITVACMGLYALAILGFSQRLKEISIRKVLGAGQITILRLLLQDYLQLMVIAIFIGMPMAWFLADMWLQNFNYKVGLNVFHFVASGLALLLIAWTTLGYLTIKATRLNPVDSLKEE